LMKPTIFFAMLFSLRVQTFLRTPRGYDSLKHIERRVGKRSTKNV